MFRAYRRCISTELQRKVQAKIAAVDAVSPALIDPFQRKHDYLRISLTERCNLRCFYCMPSEGVELSPSENILTNDEVLRLASLFVRNGVSKIRLTGGEPTIRKGVSDIVASLNRLKPHGLKAIAMTTNGLVLHRRLPELVANGLSHLNISLDTLDPFKFEFMTKRRGHEAVLRTIDSALSLPLKSVKLNVVVVKGLNDSEVLDFIQLTKDPISVRFIEFMPFTGNKWVKDKMVPSNVLLDRISEWNPSIERISDDVNDTARSWRVPGFAGSFGFISSMSDHFCSSCNRVRITADGQIKVCLFDAKEVSLRDPIRQGATDEELLGIISHALSGKAEKHVHMEDIDVVTNRPMIKIGGLSIRTRTRRPFQRHRCAAFGSSASQHDPSLTHIDQMGRPSMVDVSDKPVTKRSATATGRIFIPAVAYDLVTSQPPDKLDAQSAKAVGKGNALTVAQLAAIMGAKQTSHLIPLCHPLPISHINVSLTLEDEPSSVPTRYSILCTATVTSEGKTGVEMEALTAVTVGLLTVWDMLKAVGGRDMKIGEVFVSHKSGGESGDFIRNQPGRGL